MYSIANLYTPQFVETQILTIKTPMEFTLTILKYSPIP